ncbi:MAG TPA: MBL fold metallo-hydrolase [Lacunisphaera sp.]|jgi:glyoxylase-like metal-dependent hydrolase (beta-lactamase superfamily II)
MNRRDFLLKSGAAASLGFFTTNILSGRPEGFGEGALSQALITKSGPPSQAPIPVTEFHPLRRNTGFFTGRGGTIGWLASSTSLVAIDSQFPDTAEIFLKGMPGRNNRTIDAVINTHHHADHTSGNGVFKPVTKTIVAQSNVPDLMVAAAKRSHFPTYPTLPNETFPKDWRRDFGDETISARYFRPAHTSGDIVVHLEKANVVHIGDLVFNRIYPVIDRDAGGRFIPWLATLEDIFKNYPADAIYLFGHGNPDFGVTGGHADIRVFRDYLAALLAYVGKEMKAGRTKDEISRLDNFPGFPDLHAPIGPGNRLPGNLGAAYDELASG